jgi:SEC-C motif domain protein
MIPTDDNTPCPCTPALAYRLCCGRYHGGSQYLQAPDAQVLMRSRYSAYVLDELAYLQATWHSSTRPAQLEPNAPGLRWLGLALRSHVRLGPQEASVEFVARYKLGGRATRLHEVSRFVLEAGQWFYVEAL